MVGFCEFFFWNKDVIDFGATTGSHGEAITILEALDSVDAEHGSTELGVELVEFGFAKTYGTTFDDTGNNTADGVAFRFNLGNEILHLLGFGLVGATYDVVINGGEVVLVVIAFDGDGAYLLCVGFDVDAELAEGEFGKGTANNTGDCYAG